MQNQMTGRSIGAARARKFFCCQVALLVLSGAAAVSLHAATSTWAGGAGNNNWSAAANWTIPSGVPVNNSSLIYGSVTATNTTSNNNISTATLTNIASISFVAGSGGQAFTLTGNGFTLGAAAATATTISNSNVSAETINFATLGLTLSPTAFSTQFWDDTHGAGALTVLNAVSLNGTALGLQSSGSVGAAGTINISGVISGTGVSTAPASIIIGSSGTSVNVALSGANTFGATSGGFSTALEGGTLTIKNASALGTGNLLIDNTSTGKPVTLSTDAAYTITNGVTAKTNFTTTQGGNLKVTGGLVLAPATPGTITITNAVTPITGTLNFAGVISDGGAGNGLTLTGAGKTIFSGATANTYTGLTEVTGGQELDLNKSNNTKAIVGNLQIDTGSSVVLQSNGQIKGSSAVKLNGTSTFNLNGHTVSIAGVTDDNAGQASLNFGAGGVLTTNTGSFVGNVTDSGGQAGVTELIKADDGTAGGGTLTIGDSLVSNNYTGNTQLLAGTISVVGTNALGTGTLLIDTSVSGKTATLATVGNATLGGGISTKSNFTTGQTGSLTVNGGILLDTTLNQNNTTTTAFTITNAVAPATGAVTYAGAITDGGGGASLTFKGAGRTVLSGTSANTYTGLTTVSTGQELDLNKTGVLAIGTGGLTVLQNSSVVLQQANQISTGDTVTVNGSGIFNLNGKAQTLANVADNGSGLGTINFGAGGKLTVGNGTVATNSTFTGTLLDNGAETGVTELVKADDGTAGGGTLTLTGASTYTGNTQLLAGTITIGNATALGTSTLLIDNTASAKTVTLASNNHNYTLANNISTKSNFTTAEGGNLTLNGNLTLDTSNQSTFIITNAVAAATGTVTYGGVIGGTSSGAALTFTGAGKTILAGASSNTYTGLTTVKSGQELDLNKSGGALAIDGNLTVMGTSSLVKLLSDNQIVNTATVTLNGVGALNLGGHAQTIATLADDGNGNAVLNLGTTVATGAGSGLVVGSGAFSGTIKDVGTNTGVTELTKSDDGTAGGGTLTLSGTNVYTGDTKVLAGTLALNNNSALGTGTLRIDNSVSGKTVTLSTNAARTLANNISTRSNFTTTQTGNLTVNGSLTLDTTNQSAFTITNAVAPGSGTVTYAGAIGDGGNGATLTLTGQGKTIFSGAAANTYSGRTTVTAGQELDLNKTAGTNALAGNLTINTTSKVVLLASNQIADSVAVTLNGTGLFNLNGQTEGIMSLADDGSGSGTVTLGAFGRLNVGSGGFSGIISGGTTGFVSLAKTDDGSPTGGTLALYGANTYTGVTQLDGGILAVANNNSLGSGTLDVEGATTTLTTTALPSPQVSPSTVALANAITLNANRLSVAGGVSVSGTPSLELDGLISGTGGIDLKQSSGVGIIDLNNNMNSYSGGTTVTATLAVVGQSNALGAGNVTNGGFIFTPGSANGFFAGVLPPLAGTTRTITVGADFTQTSLGGLYLADYNPGVAQTAGVDYDQVVVQGQATLDGGLTFDYRNTAAPAYGQKFVLLQAGAPIAGVFNAVVTNLSSFSGNYIPVITYDNDEVVLTLNDTFSMTSGLTPNQMVIARNIDANLTSHPTGPFATVLVAGLNAAVNAGTLPQALDQLSPQSIQVFRHIGFDNFGFASSTIDNHLASLRYGQGGLDTSGLQVLDPTNSPMMSQIRGRLLAWNPNTLDSGLVSDVADPILGGVTMSDPKDAKNMTEDALNRWSAFINGNVILADVSHDADVAHTNYTTGGVTAGADYRIDRNWTLGGVFNYSHTGTDSDEAQGQTRVDSYSPGIYAGYVDGGWYANGLAAYNYNSYSESRNIAFLGTTANGNPDGNQFDVNADGGYEFKNGRWTFGPTAALQYVHLQVNSFTESGAGPADLQVNDQQDDSLRSRLGVSVRYQTTWWSKVSVTPHFSASWQHEFLDNSRGITSQFDGLGGGSFSVQGENVDRDSALVDAGLDTQWSKNFSLFVDYQTQAGQDDFFAQSISAGIKIGF